jgi:hypothetical protein
MAVDVLLMVFFHKGQLRRFPYLSVMHKRLGERRLGMYASWVDLTYGEQGH